MAPAYRGTQAYTEAGTEVALLQHIKAAHLTGLANLPSYRYLFFS